LFPWRIASAVSELENYAASVLSIESRDKS
jgi:hypothetical protein